MESLKTTIYEVNQSVTGLQHSSGTFFASLSVAEKRMELRSKRPAQELVRDLFQEALEQESEALKNVRQNLSEQIEAGQGMLSELELALGELQKNRHTMPL